MNSDLISVFVNIQHMKYLLTRLRILKNDTKALIQCAFEKQIIIFEIRAQKHNDNVIMLTERADKTENRDPNVFNFVYLFIILGK